MVETLHTKDLPGSWDVQPKTLIIFSAHGIARVFLMEDKSLHELASLHTSDIDYQYSDNEWFSYSSGKGGGTIPGFSEKNDIHADRVFAKFLAEEIQKLVDSLKPEDVIVYMPANLQKSFKESASKKLIDSLSVKSGNHVKSTIPDVFTVLDSLKK